MKQLKFIDRDEELKFLKNYFNSVPNALLFVFGPKSSGKSTLIMEVIKDMQNKDFVFFYYDLRTSGISNYYDFVDFFTKESKSGTAKYDIGLNLYVFKFGVTKEKKNELKSAKKLNDVFDLFFDEINQVKKDGKTPVIIIDELQMLREIYTNGGRALLEYLFNFFVTITKVKHLAHVLVSTSDSLFIEEIYNNSSLKKTSEFYLVDMFDEKTTTNWMKEEGFSDKESKKIWDEIGGEPWYLQELLKETSNGKCVTDIIQDRINESVIFLYSYFLNKRNRKAINILKLFRRSDIISVKEDSDKIDSNLLTQLVQDEVLFYNPINGIIKPQSRLMLKAIREIIKIHKK